MSARIPATLASRACDPASTRGARLPLLVLAAIAALTGPARSQVDARRENASPAQEVKRDKEADRRAQEAEVRKAENIRKIQMAQEAARAQVAVRAAPVQQAWSDEQFEQWALSPVGNADGARRRFESQLTLQIDDIDRTCHLTAEQKKKLQLMGYGDAKRVLDSFEIAKSRFNALGNDVQKLGEVMQYTRPLSLALQGNLFDSGSLLCKALRHCLTDEQFARYDVAARDRRAFRHRAQVELAVAMLDQAMPLRDSQRRDLIALLMKETKPVRASGQYEYYAIMDRVGSIPEEKLKPLFSNPQWKVLERQVNQYRGVVQNLRRSGYIVDDDDDGPQE